MDHHERRAVPRREISYTVRIATGISDPLDCPMTDVSLHGARLTVHDPDAMPQHFIVIFNDDLSRWCEVVWRKNHAVGVKFVRPPKTVTTAPVTPEHQRIELPVLEPA